jgi:uncharacterized protein YlxW (UPF0749 family)
MKLFPLGTHVSMKTAAYVACFIFIVLGISLSASEVARFKANNELTSVYRDHRNELSDLKHAKNEEIKFLREKLKHYNNTIDSVNTEIGIKDKQLDEIDKQNIALIGDSIGIVNALKRVFANSN